MISNQFFRLVISLDRNASVERISLTSAATLLLNLFDCLFFVHLGSLTKVTSIRKLNGVSCLTTLGSDVCVCCCNHLQVGLNDQ